MFDLSAFRLQDMALCSTTIRQLGEDATSIESVADRITRFLYTNLTTGPDEDPACVLVRAFKTHPYNRLAPELQALVDARLGGPPASPDMKCLTLLGSTGAVSGWNKPALSSRFRVIPLAGPETLEQLPMFAQLFAQFHIDLPYLQETPVSLLLDKHATTFNAFYVPQAVDSPYVPGQQDFVVPFGVQSVFGCGGLLPTGDMFALILFSKIAVSKETADLFKTIALSVKLALSPFENPQLILPAATAASGTIQQPATLNDLQDRVATLEAILAVQEQAVDVQSRRLEDNLSEAIRQGQKLQKQSVRFETLSATSPVGIFETDADGACLYTNAAWQAIAGLTLADTLGDGWSRAILDEDRSRVFAHWNRTAKAGEDFALEFRMQRSDGVVRWVHARSRPLKNEAGQIVGHVGTTEDITERKQTEAVLHAQRQQLQAIVDGTSDAVFIKDLQGKYLLFNKAGARFVGKQPTDVIGLDDTSLFPPDDARAVMEGDRRVMAGGTILTYEDHVTTSDGVRRTFSSTKGPLFDQQGAVSGMFGISRDVTQHKHFEETLRQSEERYRRYFELGLIGMAVTSLEKGWVQVNDRLCEIFGYSHDELRTKTWTELTHPDDIAPDVAQFNRVLAGEIDGYSMDKRFLHKDGHVIYASISASAVRRTDGAIDHFVALVQDITARHTAEERLKENERQLQRQIDEMPIGHIVWDRNFRIESWNPAAERIFGYTSGEAIGHHASFLIPEEYRSHVDAVWQKLLAGDQTAHSTNDNLTKAGRHITCQWANTPLRDAGGQVVGAFSMVQDVTEQRMAQDAVRQSEARLQALADTVPVLIWIADTTKACTWFNKGWLSFTGRSLEQEYGNGWAEGVHPDDFQRCLDTYVTAFDRRESFEMEYRLRHRDGTYHWLIDRGSPQYDATGVFTGYVGGCVDIQDQRNTAESLRRTEERWMYAFEGSGDGVWDWNASTNKVFFSNRWKSMLGYAPEEIGDSLEEWSSRVHPDDLATAMADVQRHLRGETPVYVNEHRMRCKDSSYKWILDRGKVVSRAPDGSPLRVVGTHTDITDRRRLEEITAHSRHQATSFIEHTPAPVAMLDRELRYVAVSRRWLEDYRLGEQNIIGKHHYDVFPEIRAMEEWQAIHQRCLAGAVEKRDEQRFVRADGSENWLRWEVRPWQDETGTIGGIIMFTEDITQRKDTENALLQSTTLQKALLTYAGYAVIAADPTGLITVFNPAAEQLLGYSAEEMIGKQTPAIFHDHDEVVARAAEFGAELGITMTPGFDVFVEKARRNLPNQHEWTYIRKDGRRIPVMLSVTTLRDASGTITGYIAMALDLTDRKAADAQFQTVMEAMPTGIILVDETGRITMVNQHVGRMFGYKPGELLGQPVETLLPERFRATHPTHVRRFFLSPTARAMGAGKELSGLRKDRTEFFLEIGLAPIHTPQGVRIVASIADITKRKQMESTRFRLQQAVNHAQDGMALLDESGEFTYMNPAYASTFGYTVDQLLGTNWKKLYPAEWAAMIEQMYLPTLRSEGQWQGEVVGEKISGEAFHVDLSLSLLEEPGTGHQTILSTCRDITARKRMEQELIGAKEAAEAGMRTKSEFLATMSHEIRTPMNGVLGMTGLLLDTTLTPEQQDYARTLKHSGESLMRIINDILDFSKIESGKMTIERIPFDLRLTIEDTLELLAPGAQSKQLELVGLIAASLPTAVIGDPGRIRQILTNLIGNAIKFTDRGEVLVQVMPVDDESSTLKLRFEIIDTGVGLDAEAQAKLFQSFTQADSSTARKYGGTGLGLAICKRLAELMGGNIGMYSIPGTGTCVWFTILLEAQAESSSPAVLHAIDNLKGLRICLVDDNATNRSLLQYHASAWEMPYDSAEDGAAALLLLKQAARDGRPFDLAIIDMHMPGMDGMQLAHAIKEDPSLSHTKLVLLTSLGRRGDAKLAQAAGFSGYLTKPVRKAHLYDCLRLVMGQGPVTLVPEGAEQADSALITRHQIAELHAQVKLLVVDDNLINQKVAVKMLEKLGYRPDVATNGKEALLALSRHSYDLVFMDCQMPELDGFETTRMIRTHEKAGRRLPIIAMTANAMEGDREHCLSAGMDDFVSKPVKSQELQRVLTQWLHPPDDRAAA